MMRGTRGTAVVIVLLALPALLAAFEATRFYAHNRNNGSLVSSGVQREYRVYVPRSYAPSRSTPLVISLHGAGGWPVQQMVITRWNALADRERFIVVYPFARAGAGPRIWRVEEGAPLAVDVRFIADLIDRLARDYNIDRSRVYVNGLSNGGGMSFALSCALADRIAAVGMVAAAQTLPWQWCRNGPSVPVIAFHGTADPVVPYNGGVSWISPRQFPQVPGWLSKWAARNRCAAAPRETEFASGVTRREYVSCAGDAAVVLYTIRGGGHTWPGGAPLPAFFVGPTSHAIDATKEMWAFFRAHPLRNRTARLTAR